MKTKNIVIVGGGAAGWATALMVNRKMPHVNITLIESEEIGILGAGEGTVLNFIDFLNYVGIGLPEFFSKTNATCKNGVKFTNWNGDNRYYYHNFFDDNMSINKNNFSKYDIKWLLNTYNDIDPENCELVALANNKNKSLANKIESSVSRVGNFAVHFDATLLAKFLKEKSLSRGIKRIEGKVSEIINNKNDFIDYIVVNNNKIYADFIFDCTGFARMIIGKHYKTQWNSYSNYLPVNSAIPFFLEINENQIEPYTESIAMKYGWIWKIPLQNRYGCGYVFDSNYISEDDAIKEIEEYLQTTPVYPRKDKGPLKFEPGSFEKVWVKNCFAVGVSTGFVEPLEATSFYTWLEFLKDLLSDTNYLFEYNENYINNFNIKWKNFNEEVMNFIYLHYVTKKNDTEFWKKFKNIENAPFLVKSILNKWEYAIPRYDHFKTLSAFIYENWVKVGYGLNLLNNDLIKKTVIANEFDKQYNQNFIKFNNDLKYTVDNMLMNHFEYITFLKEQYES